MAVCLCFIGKASAQWVVSDPGNLAQGIINTTKQIVQTSTTAKNTLDGFMEAQKIFQQGKKYYDALKAVHDVNPEKPDVPLNKNDAFQKVQKRHVQEKR